MNRYSINDIYVGMNQSFSKEITDTMMDDFYQICGDENPLHREKEFARRKGFNDRVVYGMLGGSLVSTLGGVYLPGENCLIREVALKFVRPVYIGDTLTVIGEVKRVEVEFNYIEVDVCIRNQHGEKVIRGMMKASVTNE